MRWFGESWGAPVCAEEDRVEVPVGRPCLGCGVAIEAGGSGLVIPFLGVEAETEEPWHLDCFLRSIFGDREVPPSTR
jgi:hypothetical protein